MEPQSIAIVGGRGRMGSLLGRFLSEAGYRFTVVDRLEGPVSWQAVAESDVTVLAVPIPTLDDVVRELGPFTRDDAVVIDIASVKARPVASMLKHCRGEVIGTHPLFGPATSTLEDQIVFVCPARGERWVGWLTSWLEGKGATVTQIDPEEHDRLMAEVQVLRHLLLLCFGRTLMKREFDLAANLPRSGRWFATLVRMLERQLDQSPELYADIGIHNPASRDVAVNLVESVVSTAALYASRDRAGLVELMNEVSAYLRSARDAKES
ncbi:MAG: prephenate dehydrogenase/arogenate dehydrogenase family protein [Desulfomonile tiedjei]|nr:prephenate dehydrogenase/arogenate dehydrogenase family protein [Desulfomonile tiedjei]